MHEQGCETKEGGVLHCIAQHSLCIELHKFEQEPHLAGAFAGEVDTAVKVIPVKGFIYTDGGYL